ncbi:MAG: DUF2281 domain-containing protein [Cyanobacteria bacterium Co-bin13]|nr:DUF2281 domain-containing protein [Cyanobacteria bacterium Co-bin13]
MTTKEQILQELDQIPEQYLPKVLEFLRHVQQESQEEIDEAGWQAYLESEKEREEVYRRLANA